MAEQATRFGNGKAAWRQAAVVQKHLKALPVTGFDRTAANEVRQNRRKKDTRHAHSQGPSGAINTITQDVLHVVYEYYEANIKDDPNKKGDLETFYTPEGSDAIGNYFLRRMGIVPTGEDDIIATLTSVYSARVFRAALTDAQCLDEAAKFLADPGVVLPFFERLKEIAETADRREFPGLLEMLAVHNEQTPIASKDNILYNALLNATADDTLLADFLQQQIFEGDPNDKALSAQAKAAAGIMQLIFKIEHPELNQALALERLLGTKDTWPAWFKDQFKAYKNEHIKNEWASIEGALRPHMHRGRANHLKLAPEKVKAPKGGVAEFHEMLARQREQARQIIEDALRESERPEEEPEPIEQFVFLKSTGTGSDRVLTHDGVLKNLDDVMGIKAFRSYIDAHREDKTLEPQLRQALEMLASNPYCHEFARKYMSGSFNVLGLPDKQTTRRFSFQKFPGSGKIARQSRLYYALLHINGKDTLAFLSFKNKNETGSGLPLA